MITIDTAVQAAANIMRKGGTFYAALHAIKWAFPQFNISRVMELAVDQYRRAV